MCYSGGAAVGAELVSQAGIGRQCLQRIGEADPVLGVDHDAGVVLGDDRPGFSLRDEYDRSRGGHRLVQLGGYCTRKVPQQRHQQDVCRRQDGRHLAMGAKVEEADPLDPPLPRVIHERRFLRTVAHQHQLQIAVGRQDRRRIQQLVQPLGGAVEPGVQCDARPAIAQDTT